MTRTDIEFAGERVAVLAADIDRAVSFDDLGAAIERFSDAAPYQILHFSVFKITNTLIRDVFYARSESEIPLREIIEELRTIVVDEALLLMAPIDLLHHEFQTCDTGHFDQLRQMTSSLNIGGVIAVPYKHQNTISIIFIRCGSRAFLQHRSEILPTLFLLVSKTFARFPAQIKSRDGGRLTDRDAPKLRFPIFEGSRNKSLHGAWAAVRARFTLIRETASVGFMRAAQRRQ